MLMTIIAEEFRWNEGFLKKFEHAADSLHCFPSIDA